MRPRSSEAKFRFLKYVGDDFIRNLFAILIPRFTIFVCAALVVSKGAIEKKNRKEAEVKVREEIAEKGWDRPEKGS